MTGQAHWLTLVVVLGGALVIGMLVFALGRVVERFVKEKRRFECPVKEVPAEAVFVRNTLSGDLVDVTRCTALSDPDVVTCEKACLAGLNGGWLRSRRLREQL